MKYPNDYINKIICGNCIEVMKEMPDNSIDTIITDPPYGLEFMGKDWDKFKAGKNIAGGTVTDKSIVFGRMSGKSPSWYQIKDWKPFQDFSYQWATEVLRIAKPGATLLCFGGTRTYHRLACAIEDAGWILKDCIMWLYGSGFPKATDISKQIDKNILRIDMFKPFAKHYEKQRKVKGLTHNQICEIGNFYDNYNHGGASSNWSLGMNVPTLKQWNILQPLLNLSDEFLPLIKRIEAEREVIGIKKGLIEGYFNPGIANYKTGEIDITLPATPEAILWDGWKSHGLKPAYEPILEAMKPNEGSYANNAMKWGVAGLNVDGGRIGTEEEIGRDNRNIKNSPLAPKDGWNENSMKGLDRRGLAKGRFPANIILDEEAAKLLDEQSGTLKSGAHIMGAKNGSHAAFGKDLSRINDYDIPSDSGGASRFFYCAKASKGERNRGCENLYWLNNKLTTKEIWEELNKENELNKDNKNFKRHNIARGNIHPTVKSLSLMKYLCTITKTPTGGIVLDPFCGSGTTLMACKELKRDYMGIDSIKEYCEIARRRIKAIPETLF